MFISDNDTNTTYMIWENDTNETLLYYDDSVYICHDDLCLNITEVIKTTKISNIYWCNLIF